ncbi:hypothetical protein D9615_007610 [Tricholomella constricta]|uniref:Ion transport domain-containing protein n=1 Tax=Tricholomella constricta TaxID=117010 RepID=A0A8H5M2D8_9AGAR|nr:hypothetical protein D9615_007610 [Tricholomella constricta]
MQKSLVQDYIVPKYDTRSPTTQQPVPSTFKTRHYSSKSLNALERLFAGETRTNDLPMSILRQGRAETAHDDEAERHLELLASVTPEAATSQDVHDAMYERRAQKADLIQRDHPTYDKTFWIFSQKNIVRRLCVQPASGERIFGTPYSSIAHPILQLLLLLTVIGGIVIETIATPICSRNYFLEHGLDAGAWFDVAVFAFGFLLVVEFIIKIIANGFAFTPNAYIRSIWNVLDFFIMVGILINITTGLIFIGGLSRFTKSLKALLVDLIGCNPNIGCCNARHSLHVPLRRMGPEHFHGENNVGNDNDASGITDCIGEYTNTALGEPFGFPVPRVWDNPSPSTSFSFDNFKSSLLILFEIVSLEGWTDVMGVATSITGKPCNRTPNNSTFNAIFFVV